MNLVSLLSSQLNFGISVPDVATATIFLDLDADATLDLSLNAFASGSVSSNGEAGASAEVDGCVELDAGFSANAGVEGSFFGLFDASDQFTIYSNQWDLFKVSRLWSLEGKQGAEFMFIGL